MIDWDAMVVGPLLGVFGEAPSARPRYTPAAGGVPFEIEGVFDDAYTGLVMSADGEPEIATAEPVMGVRLADFIPHGVLPEQGGTVEVPRVGKTFVVTNAEPDGKGWVFLRLGQKLP